MKHLDVVLTVIMLLAAAVGTALFCDGKYFAASVAFIVAGGILMLCMILRIGEDK